MKSEYRKTLRAIMHRETMRRLNDFIAFMTLQPVSYATVEKFKQAIADQNQANGDEFYTFEEEPHLVTFYEHGNPFFCLYEVKPNQWQAKDPTQPAPTRGELCASMEGFASFATSAKNNDLIVKQLLIMSKTEKLFRDQHGNALDARVTQVNNDLVQLHFHDRSEAHLIMSIRRDANNHWDFRCE